MSNYKQIISTILKELGIPANLKGYHYLCYAIELLINNISLMNSITTVIYPNVAQKFDSNFSRVERGIRVAIETGWVRANEEFSHKLFGYSVSQDSGKPTNSEFMVTIADYVLMQQ